MVCLVVGIDYGLFKPLNWILLDSRTCLKGIFTHLLTGCQEGILCETLFCLVQAGFLCCLKCCFYSDFGFSNATVANMHIFHNDAENVVNISCSAGRAGLSQLSPGVGVKLTAPPCCQGCRVNPRGHLNLEGQLSNPTMPSSNITSYPLHTLRGSN